MVYLWRKVKIVTLYCILTILILIPMANHTISPRNTLEQKETIPFNSTREDTEKSTELISSLSNAQGTYNYTETIKWLYEFKDISDSLNVTDIPNASIYLAESSLPLHAGDYYNYTFANGYSSLVQILWDPRGIYEIAFNTTTLIVNPTDSPYEVTIIFTATGYEPQLALQADNSSLPTFNLTPIKLQFIYWFFLNKTERSSDFPNGQEGISILPEQITTNPIIYVWIEVFIQYLDNDEIVSVHDGITINCELLHYTNNDPNATIYSIFKMPFNSSKGYFYDEIPLTFIPINQVDPITLDGVNILKMNINATNNTNFISTSVNGQIFISECLCFIPYYYYIAVGLGIAFAVAFAMIIGLKIIKKILKMHNLHLQSK